MGSGHVTVLGEQDVAALATQDDRVAEQRKRRTVHVAADDDRQPPPETRVRCSHDLGPVLERLRRRDDFEPQQFLADPKDVAGLERLLGGDLEEHAVQAAEIPDQHTVRADRELGVAWREVGVGVEQRALASAEQVLAVLQRMGAPFRAVGPDEDQATARRGCGGGSRADHVHRAGLTNDGVPA